jgi:hypothetical protein
MNHQFKPGDLALLIHSTHGVNLGKVVELLRCDSSEKIRIPEEGERCFTPNPDRMICWVVRGEFVADSTMRGVVDCAVAACPQSWLMPLRGDFAPAEQKSRAVSA